MPPRHQGARCCRNRYRLPVDVQVRHVDGGLVFVTRVVRHHQAVTDPHHPRVTGIPTRRKLQQGPPIAVRANLADDRLSTSPCVDAAGCEHAAVGEDQQLRAPERRRQFFPGPIGEWWRGQPDPRVAVAAVAAKQRDERRDAAGLRGCAPRRGCCLAGLRLPLSSSLMSNKLIGLRTSGRCESISCFFF